MAVVSACCGAGPRAMPGDFEGELAGAEDGCVVVASGALEAKGLDALAGAALAGKRLAPVLLNGNDDYISTDRTTVALAS